MTFETKQVIDEHRVGRLPQVEPRAQADPEQVASWGGHRDSAGVDPVVLVRLGSCGTRFGQDSLMVQLRIMLPYSNKSPTTRRLASTTPPLR